MFLTLFKTRDVGTNSFAGSGLGGDRTGPGSILRFLSPPSPAPAEPVPRRGRPRVALGRL